MGSHSCSAVHLIFPGVHQLKEVKWPQRARTDGPCHDIALPRSWPPDGHTDVRYTAIKLPFLEIPLILTTLLPADVNIPQEDRLIMFGLLFVNDMHS